MGSNIKEYYLGLYWLNPCTDGNQDSLAASQQFNSDKKDNQGITCIKDGHL